PCAVAGDARGRAPGRRPPCASVQLRRTDQEAIVMKPRYNCLKCPGYCCSHARIAVSDYDIARLARHFGISPKVAKERFTYRYRTKDADEQILRHQTDHVYKSICRFFHTDERRCTVYEARRNVC